MKNRLYIGVVAAALCFAFAGCDDNIDPLVTEMEITRPFTPTKITTVNGPTQATITWEPSPFSAEGDVTYTVEISKEINFSVVDFTLTTANTQAVVTNENIQIKEDHYARVKPVDKNGASGKYWIVSSAFQITGEQIFLNVTEADLNFSSVTLKWTTGGNVTHIIVTPDNDVPAEHPISDDEKAANAKTITGLTPGMNYTAEIFNGETSRGTTTFTTFSADVPEAELIVFLKDNMLIEEQIDFSVVSVSSITLVFEQDKVYDSNVNMTLAGNNTDIHFYGMPGPNSKPVVSFTQLTLPALGGKIKFSNLDLTGYPSGNSAATKRAYIFNQSAATQTQEVNFDNCTLRNFENTPFRIQSAGDKTVEKLVFNNCIVYDVSTGGQNYAFINSNTATGIVKNIELTNSTFYHIKIGLILHNAAPSQSVTISNCTISDISVDDRALIDYNAQSVTTFTFSGNIVSKSKGATTVRGIRIGASGVTVPSSSFVTSDYVATNNPIGGATAYAGSSTDLFVDPAAGNFNFKDANFAGKSSAGDPRWHQ